MENKIMKEVAFTIQHIKDLISKKTQCDKKGRNVSSIETFFGQKTLPEQASEKGGTFYALVYVSRPVSKEYTIIQTHSTPNNLYC